MTIQFCPKCKNILTITTKENKQYLTCTKCKIQSKNEIKEKIISTEEIKQKETGKGTAEKTFEGHNFRCKKCNNDKCEITDLGMMFGDEDWVYLLKCTKCNNSERIGEYC